MTSRMSHLTAVTWPPWPGSSTEEQLTSKEGPPGPTPPSGNSTIPWCKYIMLLTTKSMVMNILLEGFKLLFLLATSCNSNQLQTNLMTRSQCTCQVCSTVFFLTRSTWPLFINKTKGVFKQYPEKLAALFSMGSLRTSWKQLRE